MPWSPTEIEGRSGAKQGVWDRPQEDHLHRGKFEGVPATFSVSGLPFFLKTRGKFLLKVNVPVPQSGWAGSPAQGCERLPL